MINCLITGGAGFIGSHLTELLLTLGHDVTIVDNLSVGRESNIAKYFDSNNFNFVNLDIGNFSQLESVYKGKDWIFHLAALADIVPSIENPEDYFQSNVVGTYNVARLARKHKVKKLIYAASSSCYGIPKFFPTNEEAPCEPQYPYALTKYLGEQILMHWSKIYDFPIISLRLFNVYGPRARTSGTYGAVFGVFLAQKLARIPFTVVGDGTQTRDFTYVTDVCRAFLAAAESKVTNEVFNVGSGNTYQVNELVKLLNGPVVNLPKRPGEPHCTFADITKIKHSLGWEPRINLEQGVEIMLSQIDDWKNAPLWDVEKIEKATKSWFLHLSKSNPIPNHE